MHLAQSTTLESRRAAALAFARDFGVADGASAADGTAAEGAAAAGPGPSWVGCRVLVDDPELGEPFERAFAPWPVRFFVLQRSPAGITAGLAGDGVRVDLKFASAPRDGGFIDLAPFGDALRLATAKPLY